MVSRMRGGSTSSAAGLSGANASCSLLEEFDPSRSEVSCSGVFCQAGRSTGTSRQGLPVKYKRTPSGASLVLERDRSFQQERGGAVVAEAGVSFSTGAKPRRASTPPGRSSSKSAGKNNKREKTDDELVEDVERYCRRGQISDALKCLPLMDQRGIWPSISTYGLLLQQCAKQKALDEGRQIHRHIIANESDSYTFLANNLVRMYAVCGALGEARQVFDKVEKKNVFTWTAIISGYGERGFGEEALALFHVMQEDEVKPDKFLYTILLNICGRLCALEEGRRIHTLLVGDGLKSDMVIGTALVAMYAKCGKINFARKVFNKMRRRDVVSWSAIIQGYAQLGHGSEALALFHQMQQEEDVEPNGFTFASVLSACASIPSLDEGRKVHALSVKAERDQTPAVASALINMYSKCGSIEEARQVFDKLENRNSDAWTTMINGYAQASRGEEAVTLYKEMKRAGVEAGVITYACLLHACRGLEAVEEDAKQIHEDIAEAGLESDPFVGAALIEFYVHSGQIQRAREAFDRVRVKELASWNAMICGYVDQGKAEEALQLFHLLQQEGLKPDTVTFTATLNACAGLAALDQGRELHDLITRTGHAGDISVQSALVDMYSKSGALDSALEVFTDMPEKDVVAWTAIISGHALHGQGKEAITLFEEMQEQAEVTPSDETFAAVLSACTHEGLVEEGLAHFKSMRRDHNIVPTDEHCSCVVSLLGRAGRLDHAEAFLLAWPAPSPPTPDHFMLLLAACQLHNNVDVAERAASSPLQSPRHRGAALELLASICGAAGKEAEEARYRELIQPEKSRKPAGRCWLEVDNRVQSLANNDTSHPLAKQVRREAAALYAQLQELSPDLAGTETDCYHSELLAIALAQMKSVPGIPIRFMKNLRLCSHCHAAIKLISQHLQREIIARDANRFHHFRQGSCNCGDHW